MKNKIVVIGSSNVDLIMKMEKLPEKGETMTDADFLQVYGGKGANQAVSAARAGGNVAFVNCVGDDAYTPQMLQNFRNDKMDIRFVYQETGISSGHALVMIGGEGNNYISVSPGANYMLTPEKIDLSLSVIDEAAINQLSIEILSSYEPLYLSYRKLLSSHQYLLLQAIAAENGVSQPHSGDFIRKYKLKTASSVKSSLDVLFAKEMILNVNNQWIVYDVFFSRWLEHNWKMLNI